MGSLLNDKYLFVHINKSAGGIVTENMKANGNIKIAGAHRTLYKCLTIAKNMGLNPNTFYTFTAVRNPWDRMLSMYLFYKTKHFSPEFFSGNPNIDENFNKWIDYIYSGWFNRELIHSDVNIFNYCFSNQLNWLKDPQGNLLSVNKILRHENMDKELYSFFKNEIHLKNINVAQRPHSTTHEHYSKYYNTNSKRLVQNHYQEDLDYFKYTFNS